MSKMRKLEPDEVCKNCGEELDEEGDCLNSDCEASVLYDGDDEEDEDEEEGEEEEDEEEEDDDEEGDEKDWPATDSKDEED